MDRTMLMILQMIPMNTLMDRLKDAITEYQLNPTEDNKHSVFAGASSLLAKEMVDKEGIQKVFAAMETTKLKTDFLFEKDNKSQN